MRGLIGPGILLALAGVLGLLGMKVQPEGWQETSLEAPMNLAIGTSRYVFTEPQGGYHVVALQMDRRVGNTDTTCLFEATASHPRYSDEHCSNSSPEAPKLKLSWDLYDGNSAISHDHYVSGGPVGYVMGDDALPVYMVGGEVRLRRGTLYTLVLHNDSVLSSLAAGHPRVLVQFDESEEGPLIVQALQQIGALVLGAVGALWAAISLVWTHTRGRRRQRREA